MKDRLLRFLAPMFMARMLFIEGGEGDGGGGDGGGAVADVSDFDVMDRDQRLEKANELFDAGEKEPADDKREPATAAGEEETVIEGEGDDKDKPEPGTPEAEAAEREAHIAELKELPEFQELEQYKTEVTGVLEKFGIPDTKELGLQLNDSQVLYAIMDGREPVGKLLDLAIANEGWTAEQKKGLAENLIGWLKGKGFLHGAAAAAAGGKGKPDLKDPLEAKVAELEKQLKETRDGQKQEITRAEQKRVFDSYSTAVRDEMKALKIPIDSDEHARYINAVTQKINANAEASKAIKARIAQGNFIDVKRFVAELHKVELARLQKYTTVATRRAETRERQNPRISAGGAPPVPAGSAARNKVRTRDERLAAATEEWDK